MAIIPGKVKIIAKTFEMKPLVNSLKT